MMATTAVVGLSAGKRHLSSSYYYSDLAEKFSGLGDHGLSHYQIGSAKSVIIAKRSSNYGQNYSSTNRRTRSIKALIEHVDTSSIPNTQNSKELEEDSSELDYSMDALFLLQKSMLEKQWDLTFEGTILCNPASARSKKMAITSSGVSARERRINAKSKILREDKSMIQTSTRKQLGSVIKPVLVSQLKGYVKGIFSENSLTQADVVHLSKLIQTGISLEEHKNRLSRKLGCEPSEEQLATSLQISRSELQSKLIECSLAKEKLAMSNVRMVMSIAKKYENMGAEMSDLVQGGLMGLLRGIEKYDSSKGFKMSTYVYYWIRQGVRRALAENSRTLRLPIHLHERLGLIRNAKIRLEEEGSTPTIEKIAKSLNLSQKKVQNATEAVNRIYSLDRDVFPSLNGLPGKTHHSYIADKCLENNPWHGVDEWALKEEINRLINLSLGPRERYIIRHYYGLDNKCLSYEEISKRIGLSRERVRKVGLVATEKLKHAARMTRMEAMVVKH